MRLKVFGREISIFVVAAVVLAVAASAALVSYLSNSLTASVSVESPMKMWFGSDENMVEMVFDGIYGGDKLIYKTNAKNFASQDVDVYRVVHVITSDGNWEGKEFDSVKLCDPRFMVTCPDDAVDIKEYLYHVKVNGDLVPFADVGSLGIKTVKLLYVPVSDAGEAKRYAHGAGSTIENYIEIQTAPNLIGNFSIKLCHLYELTGSCA